MSSGSGKRAAEEICLLERYYAAFLFLDYVSFSASSF